MKDVILEFCNRHVNVEEITTDNHERLGASGEQIIGVQCSRHNGLKLD
jgi:hypothetical protein